MTSAPSSAWLLYGANGYTGELIAREAVRRGMRPVLAGRNKKQITALAGELNCPSAVFDMVDQTAMLSSLEDVGAVLNCAGPFSSTAPSMIQACLASHVHYLDISGEIDTFELAHSVFEKAMRAAVVLCPGVGFDVVPTDCVAATLKRALPDATHLALGFESSSGFSKGTAKTAIESAGSGSRIRRDGKIVAVPLASHLRQIDFGRGARLAIGIPWGDVSTAYYTTGIRNIEVFMASSPKAAARMRRMRWFGPLLRRRWIKTLLKCGIEYGLKPPDQMQRDYNTTFVWGEVRNAAGKTITARLRTANGYALTVTASLGIMNDILLNPRRAGYATPSMLVGADFISTLPGCSEILLDM